MSTRMSSKQISPRVIHPNICLCWPFGHQDFFLRASEPMTIAMIEAASAANIT
jgi:hypothetical protein